jgi:uridine kinase
VAPDVLEAVVQRTLALPSARPALVAIDGVSAAGKTTFADALAPLVAGYGRPVVRASVDDFKRARSERYARGDLSPEGYYHDNFDYPAVRNLLLLPLRAGNGRHVTKTFDASTDQPLDLVYHEALLDAVLLCDGIFLFRPELNDLWDYRIFLDVDLEMAARRGAERDQVFMGSLEHAVERYRRRYTPGERIYLETVQPQQFADLVIDTTDLSSPRLVRDS